MNRKTTKIVLFFAFLLSCLACAGIALGERQNRALVIGCDNFVTMQSIAPCSQNNALMISNALSGGSLNMENVVTKIDSIYSREMFEETVYETFEDADDDDVSYIYISSHGVWEQGIPARQMKIILSNGRYEDSITGEELKEILDQIPGKIVLMVDACHSGALIGKGMHPPFENIFAGNKYKVITSGGGEEDSWFWNDSTTRKSFIGAGFFSGALQRGISYFGGYGADENKDGTITLSEVKKYLIANHGASTVECYPEEDDFPIMRYNVQAFNASTTREAVGNVEYSSDYITFNDTTVDFSFTVLKNVEIIYQLVYHRNNNWRFGDSVALYDSGTGISTASQGSTLAPGRKERSLELSDFDKNDDSDYVMLQIICRDGDQQYLVSSHVFGILVAEESPILEVLAQREFSPYHQEELGIVIHHIYPAEMTIAVETPSGENIAYLARRHVTRPQEMMPWGTSYCWNGRKSNGSMADPGIYKIHVTAYIGDKVYEETSKEFRLNKTKSSPAKMPPENSWQRP